MYYVYYDDELVAACRSNDELLLEMKDADITGKELLTALLSLGQYGYVEREKRLQMHDGAKYLINVQVYRADHQYPHGVFSF